MLIGDISRGVGDGSCGFAVALVALLGLEAMSGRGVQFSNFGVVQSQFFRNNKVLSRDRYFESKFSREIT